MAKELTSRAENYSQWYNDLVVKADLAEQSAVRGCMVIKPYGYAIWEKIQRSLDDKFNQLLLITCQPCRVKKADSALVEKRGPLITTTVPFSCTGIFNSRAVLTANARSCGQ